MAAEVLTIPRVYLADQKLARQSGHHTIYATSEQPVTPGRDPELITLTFEFGLARNVPKAMYDQFHRLGYVTTDRPKRQGDDD
jgi:hypothetical protein